LGFSFSLPAQFGDIRRSVNFFLRYVNCRSRLRVIYEVARRVKRTHSVAPSDGVLFGAVLLTINKPGLLF
jgi:hypothetical protein